MRATAVSLLAGLSLIAASASASPASLVDPDLVAARMAFGAPPLSVVMLRSFDRLFEHRRIPPASAPSLLPQAAHRLDMRYVFDGATHDFDAFLARTHTNAIVILHDGRIVAERYRNGMAADDPHAIMSISKSIVSTLVGIALDRGDIRSLDEPIATHAPEFHGTAYAGVTLRQALLMRSGVSFDEEGEDFARFLETVIAGNSMRCADFIRHAPRVQPPGRLFNYSSPETCVIARVLERATGTPLADYMAEHLWQPAGMEHQAHWVMDGKPGEGTAVANGGLSMSARDLARFGQMMLDGGVLGSRRIVSERWVAEATATDGRPGVARTDGYGYQWWTTGNPEAFVGLGYAGQALYIVPSRRLVIAKLSYWPTGGDEVLEAETRAAFSAIAQALGPDR